MDPKETDVGDWVDVPTAGMTLVPEQYDAGDPEHLGQPIRFAVREVEVLGLMPASRYRFRYRSQDPGSKEWPLWSLASLSDWFRTAGATDWSDYCYCVVLAVLPSCHWCLL